MRSGRVHRVWCHRWLVASLAIVLAGCAASSPSPTPTTVPVAPSAPTATSPAAATGPASPAPNPVATGAAAEPFDLVWFSDSSAAVADLMAQRIEQRLGVEVRVHDFWGPGHRGSAAFIADMTEVAAVEDALVDAEMIVLYANPGGTPAFDATPELCFAPEAPVEKLPKAQTAADYAPFAERLRFIYDRIFNLRVGRPTIIRAVDAYVPLEMWRAAGVAEWCSVMWETWTSVARDVAAAYDVPMASMYDALNGLAHDQDPVDKGYIGDDGVHLGDAGQAAQVDVIDALGYDPIEH